MLEATSHRIHVSENVVSQKTDILMGKMMIDDLYFGGTLSSDKPISPSLCCHSSSGAVQVP